MIAIICAMESEISFYKTILSNSTLIIENNIEFLRGYVEGNELVLTKCGIGKVNSAVVASILINKFSPKLVINTGIAGGILPLVTNDIFVANEFMYGDFDLQVFGYKNGQVPGFNQKFVANLEYTLKFIEHLNTSNISYKQGLIVTQDKFITSLSQLSETNEIIATDMEGASIAHTCEIFKTPFLSIRIISDVIGSNDQVDDYNLFEKEAAELSSKITYNFIKKI